MVPMTFDPGLGSLNFGPGVVSPVVTTPNGVSARDALEHVLAHVLCLSSDSGICLSLMAGGFVKIGQVIGMSASTMAALSYMQEISGMVHSVHLLLSEKKTLQALQGFAHFKSAHLRHTLTPGDWLTVTADEFDDYQNSSHLRKKLISPVFQEEKIWHSQPFSRFAKPVSGVPTLQWRLAQKVSLDSNMGSHHDGVDRPDMTLPPEIEASEPDKAQSIVVAPEVRDLEIDTLEVEDPAPEEGINLQDMTMVLPSHVHGESDQHVEVSMPPSPELMHSMTSSSHAHGESLCDSKLGELPADHGSIDGIVNDEDISIIQPSPYCKEQVKDMNNQQTQVVTVPIVGHMSSDQ